MVVRGLHLAGREFWRGPGSATLVNMAIDIPFDLAKHPQEHFNIA